MKILVTGGHLTPALAFIDYSNKSKGKEKISFVFVGRKFSQVEEKQKARENIEISRRKIPFLELNVPRFSSYNPLKLLPALFNYFISIIKSLIIVIQQKPDLMVSFGGYLAVPVALAAWLLRVPIITHEQTLVAGSANQFIGKLATAIAVSFTKTKQYFPASKTTITGNPIRHSLLEKKPKRPHWLPAKISKPILYITGGNQGSYIINTTITQILPQLTRRYLVVHTCGQSTNQLNYKQDLSKKHRQLSQSAQNNYYVREWIDASDLAWIMNNAHLSVSRAGANTVQEVAITKLPTIFIPLPFAKNDEQLLNAQFLSKKGAAVILTQKRLSPDELLKSITAASSKQATISKKLQNISIPLDGDKQLYLLAQKIANNKD
jgi:UDP-N-acetylglucosamine--N-acetylmuramyl-(pentapeptide) pyrophosphoryl-undecaprenol N-acetylglucosamine transferase